MKLIKFTVLYFVTLEGGKRLLKVKHLLSEPSKNRKRFHLYFLGVVISSFFFISPSVWWQRRAERDRCHSWSNFHSAQPEFSPTPSRCQHDVGAAQIMCHLHVWNIHKSMIVCHLHVWNIHKSYDNVPS